MHTVVEAERRSGMLAGRTAIITGAAGGLGQALVQTFSAEGAQVLAVDVQGDDVYHADLATKAGNEEMIAEALSRFGHLDTLILNAGAQHLAPIVEHSEAEWDRLHDVMVKGPFLALQAAWEHLTSGPAGRVVVTASGSSYIAEKFKSAYVAAKHGVVGLVKVAALEGGEFGPAVNAVAPGWMRTPMVEQQLSEQMRLHDRSREEVIAGLVSRHPVSRFVETDEVAAAIVFLASDRASGINGVCLPVDVGTLVW